jgi:hypothetical protein
MHIMPRGCVLQQFPWLRAVLCGSVRQCVVVRMAAVMCGNALYV